MSAPGWFFTFLIVCVVLWFVQEMAKAGMRHAENLARIKKGYPTLDGALPMGYTEAKEDELSRTLEKSQQKPQEAV